MSDTVDPLLRAALSVTKKRKETAAGITIITKYQRLKICKGEGLYLAGSMDTLHVDLTALTKHASVFYEP